MNCRFGHQCFSLFLPVRWILAIFRVFENATSTSTDGCIFADKTETLEIYISIPLPIRIFSSFCSASRSAAAHATAWDRERIRTRGFVLLSGIDRSLRSPLSRKGKDLVMKAGGWLPPRPSFTHFSSHYCLLSVTHSNIPVRTATAAARIYRNVRARFSTNFLK